MLLLDRNYLRFDGRVQFLYIDEQKLVFSMRKNIYTIIGYSLQIKEYSLSQTIVYGKVVQIGVEDV